MNFVHQALQGQIRNAAVAAFDYWDQPGLAKWCLGADFIRLCEEVGKCVHIADFVDRDLGPATVRLVKDQVLAFARGQNFPSPEVMVNIDHGGLYRSIALYDQGRIDAAEATRAQDAAALKQAAELAGSELGQLRRQYAMGQISSDQYAKSLRQLARESGAPS